MNDQFEAMVIINDLASMALRIESLPAHPEYTNAGDLVRKAKAAVEIGRTVLHQIDQHKRHGGPL